MGFRRCSNCGHLKIYKLIKIQDTITRGNFLKKEDGTPSLRDIQALQRYNIRRRCDSAVYTQYTHTTQRENGNSCLLTWQSSNLYYLYNIIIVCVSMCGRLVNFIIIISYIM